VRTIDAEVLRSYALAEESEVLIRGDLSFSFKGKKYQLPRTAEYNFSRLIKDRVTIIFPPQANTYLLIDQQGNQYEIGADYQRPDTAGAYKTLPVTDSAKLRAEVSETAKEQARREKQRINRGEISDLPLDYLTKAHPNLSRFPKPEQDLTESLTDNTPDIPLPTADFQYDNTPINAQISWYDAISIYKNWFGSVVECRRFIDKIFNGAEEMDEIYIEESINRLFKKQGTKIQAIK
jgi:hypothetical protein